MKTAAEGGTKKDHEDWEEKILNVVQFWQPHGEDVSHVICEREKPEIEPPENLTEEQEKNKAMVAHWNGLLDNFTQRTLALDANCKAVFSFIMSNVTRVMKGQIKQQRGFEKAQKGEFWTRKTSAKEERIVFFFARKRCKNKGGIFYLSQTRSFLEWKNLNNSKSNHSESQGCSNTNGALVNLSSQMTVPQQNLPNRRW